MIICTQQQGSQQKQIKIILNSKFSHEKLRHYELNTCNICKHQTMLIIVTANKIIFYIVTTHIIGSTQIFGYTDFES